MYVYKLLNSSLKLLVRTRLGGERERERERENLLFVAKQTNRFLSPRYYYDKIKSKSHPHCWHGMFYELRALFLFRVSIH